MGGNTDGAIRSLTWGYDSLGRASKVTSHGDQTDDPNNTADIENQIVYTYNDLGQITKTEQSHEGAVSGSTPSVQYTYDHSAAGTTFKDGARLESIIYPNGRVLFYDYGSAEELDDRSGAVKQLRETNGSGTILVEYSRTGGGGVVITDYLQPDVKLDLFGSTSGTYDGKDRFGRAIDHHWYDYTSGTVDRARYKYGYDYNGNRTWMEDTVAATNSVDLDVYYTYDGLGRLIATAQGDLNTGKTAISTLSFAQDWDLDQLNNWVHFAEDSDGNGTDDIDQDRGHNDVNEVTDIDSSSTHIGHDAAGNMTTIPKPNDWLSHYDLTWDAWHRLVQVTDGVDVVARYEYDVHDRRILNKRYENGNLGQTQHLYLSARNQILEMRVNSSTTAYQQFTWGMRHVDALVQRQRDTSDDGTLDETLYGIDNASWSVTATADTAGVVGERFFYDSYGSSSVLDGDFTSDSDGLSDTQWGTRFTARELDTDTGLQYFRSRHYHSTLGRFMKRDTLGPVDGANLYHAYFVPNSVDPSGGAFFNPGNPEQTYNPHNKTYSPATFPSGVNPGDPDNDRDRLLACCSTCQECQDQLGELFDLIDKATSPSCPNTGGGPCVDVASHLSDLITPEKRNAWSCLKISSTTYTVWPTQWRFRGLRPHQTTGHIVTNVTVRCPDGRSCSAMIDAGTFRNGQYNCNLGGDDRIFFGKLPPFCRPNNFRPPKPPPLNPGPIYPNGVPITTPF